MVLHRTPAVRNDRYLSRKVDITASFRKSLKKKVRTTKWYWEQNDCAGAIERGQPQAENVFFLGSARENEATRQNFVLWVRQLGVSGAEQ